MCVPVIAAAAAVAATAAVLGSVQSGYATAASDRANARIADQNAQIALQNATFQGEEGAQHGEIQGLKNREQMGSIKANEGASGVEVNTGSHADVQASASQLGQLDVMNIRSNAVRQAYGFQTQATGDINQASIDRSAGSNAITQGYIGGIGKGASAIATMGASGAFSGASGGTGASGDATLLGNLGNSNSDAAWHAQQQQSSSTLGSWSAYQ